jgi:hypothetical protein
MPQVRTTNAAIELIKKNRHTIDLMVIDATTPSFGDASDAESGTPTLTLLRELLVRAKRPRALVLLPHRMEDIDSHCARSKLDYALYASDFSPESLSAALTKLDLLPNETLPVSSDITVEIEIGERLTKLKIIDGQSTQNREVPVPNISNLRFYAESFRTWRIFETIEEAGRKKNRPVTGWREHLKLVGAPLYDNLVRGVLGEGLLQEYVQRPEGLSRVHFRFHIAHQFFNVPFEALYDAGTDSFIRIRAPMARRFVAGGEIHAINDNIRNDSQGLRILFVRAQVDGVMQLVDDRGDFIGNKKWYDFESLANLELEERLFKEHFLGRAWQNGTISVDFFDGSSEGNFASGLRKMLKENRFDFIHFAGHSLTTENDQTFLILPGAQRDRLAGLSTSAFAQWAGEAGVSFVYLSSCRGGSCRTVQNLVANGVPHVLGFRWDVEDDMAAKFAEVFYSELFGGKRLAQAYRNACESLHNDPARCTSPIWASPVLIMQTDDWWRRSA